ncbi:hypothetical protein TEA_005110 [Camellia sinensis var. sinensis]|uniref:PB1 domain-containing protein n=1 Tax=Camellia sinensis var. sinensis TaxID=542762 RepID=A0A4S4EZD6_CAMSN|nr:hypothetical protein TEA_005110 [Camellia sinensis var. sinensis]
MHIKPTLSPTQQRESRRQSMAENEHSLRTEYLTDGDGIRDFPPDFKSYVKNTQLLCQRTAFNWGWVFWSGEDDPRERLPPPPAFSELMARIKSCFKDVIMDLLPTTQCLLQFWKVIEIGGKCLLTTRYQPFGFNQINEGLCGYRLISLDYEFDVDGVSDEHLGLLGRVFRHQQLESTPNVQYYSCNEYPQRDRAIICNIKSSLVVPLFGFSRRCCIGVFEMVSTTEIINSHLGSFFYSLLQIKGLPSSKCEHLNCEKVKDETPEEIRKMLDVVYSTHHLPFAQTWSLCRLCNAVFKTYRTCHREGHMDDFLAVCALQQLRRGKGIVGRAISSQNLVFCKDVTQFSITEYPFAHYTRKFGFTGSFAICLRSSYIEDNVYTLEFFLPPNYTEGRDLRTALVPLLTTMKQHCKSFKVASGEELGEELSIEVLDFSEDGKLYSYQIPQTARSPNRMENGEQMDLDLFDQQLPKVDVVDTGNNVVSNAEENNIVVTYIEDNVYTLEFFLPPNYTEGRDLRTALVPLLTTMKQHCKSFKVASGEELGEELSIEVLDFSEDGELYSYQIPQTARSPNRMENGEQMDLDLFDQQLPEVDVVDTENNVVSNAEENNIVVTSVQQNCIINLSQRLQRKAGIPISLEDLQQRFGMKLKDVAESLGVSRSTVKRACREYNITWWSPGKRSKDNQLLSNKGVVQEQILESSHPPFFDPLHMQDMATASRTKPHFPTAQDTSIVTIKAKYGDDFIKFQLPVLSGMVEFQQQVAKRLNLQGGTYRVKYQDEVNDWILVVCDEDLQNYICNSISRERNTVTMLIQPITNCPS